MSFPTSVGQATHSLADTAARQTNVGKLCTAFYQSVAYPNAVITNKDDFKAVREEIALSIGRAYNEVLGVSPGSTCKGPIPVITNIAPLSGGHPNDLMSWYIRFFDCRLTPPSPISLLGRIIKAMLVSLKFTKPAVWYY